MAGMILGPSIGTILDGRLGENYAFSSVDTVATGSSKIMRNVIAGGLGLPRV